MVDHRYLKLKTEVTDKGRGYCVIAVFTHILSKACDQKQANSDASTPACDHPCDFTL